MTESHDPTTQFGHFDRSGQAHMIDVGHKSETLRQAVAEGSVALIPAAYLVLREGQMAKGDVLGVARIAGIMAAKRVTDLIPLAHSLALDSVQIDFQCDDASHTVKIRATVKTHSKTGVEMEALTAVTVAALTVYDMCKSMDKGIVLNNIRLLSKTGGKNGAYCREDG